MTEYYFGPWTRFASPISVSYWVDWQKWQSQSNVLQNWALSLKTSDLFSAACYNGQFPLLCVTLGSAKNHKKEWQKCTNRDPVNVQSSRGYWHFLKDLIFQLQVRVTRWSYSWKGLDGTKLAVVTSDLYNLKLRRYNAHDCTASYINGALLLIQDNKIGPFSEAVRALWCIVICTSREKWVLFFA